jgi:hypothetical protein
VSRWKKERGSSKTEVVNAKTLVGRYYAALEAPFKHHFQSAVPHYAVQNDMPPNRSRTLNAQGRQKSCSECAKGKRKCNLGSPACQRCRKQRLTCTYPPLPGQPCIAAADITINSSVENVVPEMSMDLDDIEHASLPLNLNVPTQPLESSTDIADFDFGTGVASLDSLSNMLYRSPNDECELALNRAYQRDRTEKTFSAAHIAPFAKSRVEWSLARLKLAPKTMIEENGTPWQHPMLYHEDMPRPLQNAYAACALYVARNGTNDEFITRFIREHAESLILTPLPDESTDLLARAHALMLYQSMLVFGGDVSLYSQAELLLPCMEQVAHALLGLADQEEDPIGSIPLYPSAVARASWAAYIFRETLRRTVLAMYHFVTMCNLLRGQLTSCNSHLALGNRLTISAQLWNAKSAFDYAVTWNHQKHFVVKELDFTEVMRDAMPEDVDVLGKMMMIGLQGEDDIKGWFYTRGGTL